jgi:hypothetical protein
MSNDPSLVSICGQVLLSSSCQRIDFFYQDFHIAGASFSMMFNSIAMDPPQLGVFDAFMPPGAGAFYHAGGLFLNRLMPHSDPYFKKAIVHECTHAIEDYFTRKIVRTVDDEAAAFIAEALFERHSTPVSAVLSDDSGDDVFSVARRTAAQFDQPGIRITPAMVQPLLQAIMNNSTEGSAIKDHPFAPMMGFFVE